jgi:hypothetical protein
MVLVPLRVELLRRFATCKIEYGDLGQELVTRAMDGMKVLGVGRLCF